MGVRARARRAWRVQKQAGEPEAVFPEMHDATLDSPRLTFTLWSQLAGRLGADAAPAGV